MRILQVIPYFCPAWAYGGPLRNAYGLCKELVKRGHEVTVFTTDTLDSRNRVKETQEIIDGIEVRRFRNLSNTIAYRDKIFISPSMIFGLRNSLRNFDMIHMHEYRTLQNLIVHHYAKKYGTPYVLQTRGSMVRIMTKVKLKQLYDILWGYRLLRDASKVVALTQIEAEQYKSMGVSPDKIEIVPNGIDLAEFENLPPRGEFRKKWGINNSQKIVLFLSRIHKIKGPDLLAKAFATLVKDYNNIQLVIAGPDDGYLLSLKKLIADLEISDKVLFTGSLYGQEKLKAYVDADVYVLPSVYETFPVAVLEACACGTPVILTDRCGIAGMIDGQAGLVVPYDKEQLQQALLHMLDDDKMRLRFGEKGKLLVREKFNWENIIKQVVSIYESCISSRR